MLEACFSMVTTACPPTFPELKHMPGEFINCRAAGGFLAVLVASFFLAFAREAVVAAPLDPIPQSTSTSRQFTVFSRDPKVRMTTASLAEEIKNVWLDVVGRPDRWQHPILIVPGSGPVKGREDIRVMLLVGDANMKRIQIDVPDARSMDSPEFAAAVYEALLMASAMDQNPSISAKAVRRPPVWIPQALTQQFLSRKNPPPGGLIEGLMQSGRTPTVTSVLKQKNPPSSVMERTVFRILSFALLRTLIESPGAAVEARAYLRTISLDSTDPGMEGLLAAFPSIGNADSLERLWTLSLARIALPTRTKQLEMRETREELVRILALRAEVPRRGGGTEVLEGAAALPALAAEQGGARFAMNIATQLMQLETRAHPLWLPVVSSLRETALELARKPRANVRKKLDGAIETLALLEDRGTRIEDFLNWVEVNRVGRPDPVFAEMLRMQEETFDAPPRKDALSLYMDKMESVYRLR